MKRLALVITAACAAIIGVAALVAGSGAQQPGPPTGTLELMSRDRETRFTFVDNPPRRRERAGDLFVINARLRDGSGRPTGRLHASFAETQAPPRVVAQGTATFILGNGQIMVDGPIVNRGPGDRTDTLAVVGGSGAFTAARGTLVTMETRRTARYVFTFAG
jgi:Dirigent-like protein